MSKMKVGKPRSTPPALAISEKAGGAGPLVEAAAAADYLTGSKEFTAKLHPAYAPYGDYDQLMRLEEWYGRK